MRALRFYFLAAFTSWVLCIAPIAFADPVLHYEPATDRASPADGIDVRGALLDVDVQKVPLGEVFSEIERQSAVRFEVADSVYDQVVSERFSDLPLVQGIRRLLIGRDYMIDHTPPTSSQGPVSMIVRVLGDSRAASRVPRPAPPPGEDPDEAAWQRAQQLRELASDADASTMTVAVERAIRDPYDTVRETALELVEAMEEEQAPARLVAEVALHDANPQLRIAALDVLDFLSDVHRDVVFETLMLALNDPDEDVQELARDLFDALEADK
jgi:hypothetical protein